MALRDDQRDDDLRALAQETRQIAASVDDGVIRRRLIEIADEILVLCGSGPE